MSLKGISYGRSRPGFEEEAQGLVVKPDVARLAFTLTAEGLEPDRALAVLKEGAEAVRRLAAAVPGAQVRLRAFHAGDRQEAKTLSEGQASLHGVVEVGLAEELDFWARAAVDAGLAALAHRMAQEFKRTRGLAASSAAGASFALREPERHRAELLRRHVARARELAEAASVPGAPLALIDLGVPGPVVQRTLSPTEVVLALPIGGRIDVPGTARLAEGPPAPGLPGEDTGG